MNMRTLVMLFVVVVGMSAGQILFKAAALKAKSGPEGFFVSLVWNPSFIAALVVYGLVTLLWVYILSFLRLSGAYPFMAISFIITPILASYFFAEPLSLRYWCGMVAIVAGLLAMPHD